ncbi:condensation domain-containing protein, partial [Streptomyces sp. CB01881]|uniref:condensation domain-containing protein n=1 Tax=Streptomyces sp. CB01881 TaxID=2078691 RepID=UPI001F11E4A2
MSDAMTIESVHPLAPMQEGMWFHALYTPEDDVYVEQVTCLIEGSLDAAAFRRAWDEVVARHTALRTSFHAVDGKAPVQAVHRAVEVPWTREDWRDVPAEERQDRLDAFLREDRARGFDPARPPLVRFALLRLDDAAHQFVWTHHHLLLDGWSVPLVLQEVAACYAAARDGRPAALPVPRPYQEYVGWLERQDEAAAEDFWRTGLRGFHEPTPLPLDRGPGEADTPPEHRVRRTGLPRSVTAELQTMARRYGITPNTVVQGAWALLLSRYSGGQDVLHGMTVAGRPADLPGVEDMVGLFINTVPVRIQVQPHLPAGDWLRGLQAGLLDLRSHEHTPLARVQSWADVGSGVPLFESLVVFENYPVAPSEAQEAFAGLTISQNETEERTNFPVTLVAVPGSALGLQLIFDHHRLAPQDATTLL